MDRGAWQATVHRTARVGHNLATKPPPPMTRWKSQRSSAGDLGKKGKHATLPIPVYFRMAFAFSTVLVLVAQLCPTLCDPVDCRHGILQARIVEWVAILFSRGSSRPRDRIQVSCIAGRFFTCWATKEAFASSMAFQFPKANFREFLFYPFRPKYNMEMRW